jgi:hypothetical protein
MARLLFLRPVLLAAAACLSVWMISNAGVAEAGFGYHGDDDNDNDSKSRVASIVTEKLYGDMFKHKDDPACPAHGFYNYTSFLRAAARFPAFGGDGDAATRKREVAAFLAQISHETTGGWATAPDGPYAWGPLLQGGDQPAQQLLRRQQHAVAVRRRQVVPRPGPHPAVVELQLRAGGAGAGLRRAGEPGGGGRQPGGGVQDGAVVLDDAPGAQTVVP